MLCWQPARQGEGYMRPSEPQTGPRRGGSQEQEGAQGAEKVGEGQCSRNMNTCELTVTQRSAGTSASKSSIRSESEGS